MTETLNSGTSASEEQFLGRLINGQRIAGVALERLRRVRTETADQLASIILKLGLLSEGDLAAEMAAFSNSVRLDLSQPISEDLEGLNLNVAFLRSHEIAPVRRDDQSLYVACWDVLDEYAQRALEFASGLN